MVLDKVTQIIATATKRRPEDISPETELTSLGMGSLDTITVLFEIEEAFDITIPNEVIPEIATVNDIVEKLQEHLPDTRASGVS